MMSESTVKAQNAVEYLASHAWMFLILALVLVGLYYLGVFNPFVLRAQPGSCYVLRPNGVGTTQFVSLGGLCNDALPKFSVKFGSKTTGFNFNCENTGSCITFLTPFATSGTAICNLTISAWAYDLGLPANGPISSDQFNTWYTLDTGGAVIPNSPVLGGVVALFNGLVTRETLSIEFNDTVIRFEAREIDNPTSKNQYITTGTFANRWTNVALVINNGIATGYVNGIAATTPSPRQGCFIVGNGTVGAWDRSFNGYISNVQVYTNALSATDIESLYTAGIGGPPINLNTILIWLPLNGNLNNYAGTTVGPGVSDGLSFSATYPTPQ